MAEEEEKTQQIKDTFKIRGNEDNTSQIRQILQEVRAATITAQNYSKYMTKVSTILTVIQSQVENEYSQYIEYEAEYKKLTKQDRTVNALENKIVPLDVFEARLNMGKRERQITSWEILALEITDLTIKKLVVALGEVAAYEIKRDTLREMKEMEDKRNTMFQEIMNSRMQIMDERFLAGLRALQDENRIDRKENVQIMSNALITAMQTNQRTVAMLFELVSRSYPEKFDEVEDMKRQFDKMLEESKIETVSNVTKKVSPKSIIDSVKSQVPDKKSSAPAAAFSLDHKDYKPPVAKDDVDDDDEKEDAEEFEM